MVVEVRVEDRYEGMTVRESDGRQRAATAAEAVEPARHDTMAEEIESRDREDYLLVVTRKGI